MFISKLNQLFKPSRILYYIDASPEEIRSFYAGNVPESISRYSNAFGTYDYPGVFFVDGLQKEVIGIEYRPDDQRIEYPSGLKTVQLDASFFYSVEIDDDIEINYPFIKELFAQIAKEDYAHRPDSDLAIKEGCLNNKGSYSDPKAYEFNRVDLIGTFGKNFGVKDYEVYLVN